MIAGAGAGAGARGALAAAVVAGLAAGPAPAAAAAAAAARAGAPPPPALPDLALQGTRRSTREARNTFSGQTDDARELLHRALPGGAARAPPVGLEDALAAMDSGRPAGESRGGRLGEERAAEGRWAAPKAGAVRQALGDLNGGWDATLAAVPERNRASAEAKLREVRGALDDLLASTEAGDPPRARSELLDAARVKVLQLQSRLMEGLDFAVPAEYADLPALPGRATVELTVRRAKAAPGDAPERFTLLVDGLNAPLSGGDFVELAGKGFYDGMEIQRSDSFVVQTGDPSPGSEKGSHGYGKAGQERRVPLEWRVLGDPAPTFGQTLEEAGRFREPLALPFNALGTAALARVPDDTGSASSQFFLLVRESEVTPAGANVLDGAYGVFGYVVTNAAALQELRPGDRVQSVRVTDAPRLARPGGDLAARFP